MLIVDKQISSLNREIKTIWKNKNIWAGKYNDKIKKWADSRLEKAKNESVFWIQKYTNYPNQNV